MLLYNNKYKHRGIFIILNPIAVKYCRAML